MEDCCPYASDDTEAVAAAVEEFVASRRRGEATPVRALVARFPQRTSEVRGILAALEAFEELVEFSLSSSESRRPAGAMPLPCRLGEYELRRELGRGGMGVVYEAWQDSLDWRVAVKVLPAGVLTAGGTGPGAYERFRREAKILASLSHPGIVSVHGFGIDKDTPFLVLELVDGASLADVLSGLRAARASGSEEVLKRELAAALRRGLGEGTEAARPLRAASRAATEPGSFERALACAFAGVCDAIRHAHEHEKGVVHRDIKPSNLMLASDGRLRVLDFGLARAGDSQTITGRDAQLGTPPYMSPEQVDGDVRQVGPPTDVWSLGVTLYELLTLDSPFLAESRNETLRRVRAVEPAPLSKRSPGIPADLETIVCKCLRKDPADRYGTVGALAQDLRSFARGDPIEARPPTWVERWSARVRPHRSKVAAGLFLVVALFVTLAVHRGWSAARRERDLVRYRDVVLEAARELHRGQFSLSSLELGNLSLFLGARFNRRDVDYSESLEDALRAVEAADPGRPEAPYFLGRLLLQRGAIDQGVRSLERALAAERDFAPARFHLELELHPERSPAQIAAGLETRLQRASRWHRTWLAIQRGSRQNDWEAVEAAASAIDPYSSAGRPEYVGFRVERRMARGIAKLRFVRELRENPEGEAHRKRKLHEALLCFQDARVLWRDYVEATLLVAKTYYLLGEPDQAGVVFDELLATAVGEEARGRTATLIILTLHTCGAGDFAERWQPHLREIDRWRLRAFNLFFAGKHDESIELAERVRSVDPDDVVGCMAGFSRLFRLRHREGPRWERERALLLEEGRRVATLYPSDYHALALYALALSESGRRQQAFEVAERLVRLQRRLGVASLICHMTLASLHHEAGEYEEARRNVRIAIERDPSHYLRWGFLGKLLRKLDRHDEARKAYEEAIRRRKMWSRSHAGLAVVHFEEGRLEEAIRAAKRATRLLPVNNSSWETLARAHLARGDLEAARRAIEEGERRVPGRRPMRAIREQYERARRDAPTARPDGRRRDERNALVGRDAARGERPHRATGPTP